MANPNVSPLHKVVDAGRWDAEPPFGRLVLLIHAAFVAAGFVPHGDECSGSWLPKLLGRTASTLSLRYTAAQLLAQPFAEPAVVSLRAVGRQVVIFVRFSYFYGPPDLYSMCIDALAAARLLAGGLDNTGRSLRRDPLLAALWKALSDGMCRRLFVKLCDRYRVPLETTFMALPDDVKVAILGKLTDGEDLLRVEGTCYELRRLVTRHDEELWKPRFEALEAQNAASFILPEEEEEDGPGAGNLQEDDDGAGSENSEEDVDDGGGGGTGVASSDEDDDGTGGGSSESEDDSNGDGGSGTVAGSSEEETSSWKERYARAKQTAARRDLWFYFPWPSWRSRVRYVTLVDDPYFMSLLFDWGRPWNVQTTNAILGRTVAEADVPGQTATGKEARKQRIAGDRGSWSGRAALEVYGKKKHPGAIHSPSSRYRWKHR